MWLVRLALRRPYTFVCAALLMGIFGVLSILRMPVDIFPAINVPVVSVIWSYGGLAPEEMERRIVTVTERVYSSTVNDVEHIESQSLNGISIIKVYFQPDADVQAGIAQLTAASQGIVRTMPPGATPPFILRFNATDVPILQLGVGSRTTPESKLYDMSANFIRTPLATIHGLTVPPPNGGVTRLINVDLDPQALYAKGLSPSDVSNALSLQNVVLPSGTVKMGAREYYVRLNSSPDSVALLGDIPVKEVNGAMVYLRDVAQVRDGSGVQTNIVRQDGRRATYMTMLKNGRVSTLDIVRQVKEKLPGIRATLPPDVKVELLADQSIFVRATIAGVLREALIAACLTALMILVFLGSWRSTFIIATSIPLAILASIIGLAALGQTLNVMTLGGLALAVGILVDDATVEIENVHRNMAQGKPMMQAILDAASQVAVPAFVSMLSICIVFMPIFALSGPAAALFRPMAMAVIFAMIASYLLSRTLVPTMVRYLLKRELEEHSAGHAAPRGPIQRMSARFNVWFERLRDGYHAGLGWAMENRAMVLGLAAMFVVGSFAMVPFIGEDFFPQVDGGSFQLHVRAPSGTRIEETELLFAQVESEIRNVVPERDRALVLDNIGLGASGLNLATGATSTVGPMDGDIMVQLKEGHRGATAGYVRELRRTLPAKFPGVTFFFQPSDIVNQVLNLGLPAPIDVQVVGQNRKANYQLARRLQRELARIPGAADVHVQQVMDAPEMRFNVDRTRAEGMGLNQREIASDLLISLSGSGQTAPSFWLNPQNGVQYNVTVMTPQYRIGSMDAIRATPVNVGGASQPQLFGNLATASRGTAPAVVSHYNVQPVFDIFLSADQRDLGGVAAAVDQVVKRAEATLPKGTTLAVRGQVVSMRTSFTGLGFGIVFAILLVYLILVINFQSWVDPLIIIMALPGALAGILWMLFVTGTTFNVPSLMGAIMAMGVATANSILLVTFAEEQRASGRTARQAAEDAGWVRLRPVCMTALAMIIGMLPMALGMGEGGEQNAPLGRAVIGGLLVATLFTLGVVPVLYSVLRGERRRRTIRLPTSFFAGRTAASAVNRA